MPQEKNSRRYYSKWIEINGIETWRYHDHEINAWTPRLFCLEHQAAGESHPSTSHLLIGKDGSDLRPLLWMIRLGTPGVGLCILWVLLTILPRRYGWKYPVACSQFLVTILTTHIDIWNHQLGIDLKNYLDTNYGFLKRISSKEQNDYRKNYTAEIRQRKAAQGIARMCSCNRQGDFFKYQDTCKVAGKFCTLSDASQEGGTNSVGYSVTLKVKVAVDSVNTCCW